MVKLYGNKVNSAASSMYPSGIPAETPEPSITTGQHLPGSWNGGGVVLAIPNYNMGSELKRLLPTVINRGYEHIYVLDDCSTDNSKQIVAQFGKTVTFVGSSKNIGAGPTRNRILKYQQKGIVHFLDADMALQGSQDITPQIIDAFGRHPDAAVIGFRVRHPDGSQYAYNFGPKMRTLHDLITGQAWRMSQKQRYKRLHPILQKKFDGKWQEQWGHAHLGAAEHEHRVGSVVECNMAVRLESFAAVGGFDKKLRFHEIQALAYRLAARGEAIWYVPEVVALKHNEVKVRPHRLREQVSGQIKVETNKLLRRYHRTKTQY